MKFVIATQELNFLLSKCLNIIPIKPTAPILGNIQIEAVNDELIFTATDLMVGIRCFTDAKILAEGSTALPARRLAQLVKELTAVNVEIATNSNQVTEINANSSRFKLNGMSCEEFPSLPELEDSLQIKMLQADLKEVLYRTSFAVSREDSRYVLTGTSLSIANGKAIFVGTDGKRLAKVEIPVAIDNSIQGVYIIPIKAIEEIQKNLLDEGDVVLYLMKDKIAVEANQTLLISKLLSGDYPDINRVIPFHNEVKVTLHREELSALLRQITPFIGPNVQSVRFTFSNGELTINVNAADIGEGKVSMPVDYHGKMIEIAFNPGFFHDILRHCRGETVTLAINDAYNPGLITDDWQSTTTVGQPLFVIMPMRLSEE
jgi:DNA polymerase-3 subunit beta